MTGLFHNKKVHSVLLFFVVLGTVFANVHMLTSVAPKTINTVPTIQTNEHLPEQTYAYELDSQSLTEIMNYIRSEAANNNFKITSTVISSALLFESKEALIIIGHGHFDATGDYFIGDYSKEYIQYISQEKEVVALLGCYSAAVELVNTLELTYNDRIDIKSAMTDLCIILGWTQINTFLPTQNIQLHELDPGPGGTPGYINTDFFNDEFYAYTYHCYTGEYIAWNLRLISAIESANDYLLAFQNAVVWIVGSGYFTVRYVKTYLWGLITEVTTSYEYHEFKCRVRSYYENNELNVEAYDFIADDTYTNPNDPTYKISVQSLSDISLAISDSDAIKAAGVLATIGAAFFAGGIAATIKFGATFVFATIFGIALTGELLISIGLILFIICIVIITFAVLSDSTHSYIILESE